MGKDEENGEERRNILPFDGCRSIIIVWYKGGALFMEHHSTTAYIAIVVLVIFSEYFSATETAFTSLNRARMKNLASDGDRRAKRVLKLSDHYDKLLITLLIGNNIVNVAMTAIATVVCVRRFGDAGATIATVAITVIVLIFGEITPKSRRPDRKSVV